MSWPAHSAKLFSLKGDNPWRCKRYPHSPNQSGGSLRKQSNLASPQPSAFRKALWPNLKRKRCSWLGERTPAWINSDHLTALGFAGNVGAGICYALAAREPGMLLVVVACLAVNWLGDSVDGTLARMRNRQRPRYGCYVDQCMSMGFISRSFTSGQIQVGMVVGEGLLRCAQDFSRRLGRRLSAATSTRACALPFDKLRGSACGLGSSQDDRGCARDPSALKGLGMTPSAGAGAHPTFARAVFAAEMSGWDVRANVGHPDWRRRSRESGNARSLDLRSRWSRIARDDRGGRLGENKSRRAALARTAEGGCPHTSLAGARAQALIPG